MAQRINITVPDDLHARLQKWRERVNVSAICQEALEKEVSRLEAVPSHIEDLDEVVARLRREKEEYERESFEKGLQFGLEWARSARYLQLKRWVRVWEREKRSIAAGRMDRVPDVPDPDDLFWEELGEDWHTSFRDWDQLATDTDLLERYPSLKAMTRVEWFREGFHALYLNTGDKDAFKRGWFEGLDTFWRSVKDMI